MRRRKLKESYDYFEGLDDEWAVRIETADKGWED